MTKTLPHYRVALAVAWAVTTGCGTRSSSDGGSSSGTPTTSATSTTGDLPELDFGGPGDGDGDSGSDEEYCDLSAFEVFEPAWLVEEVDREDQTISAIVLADDAVFVAGTMGPDSGFLERKTLAGERTWLVDEPMMTGYVGADASHLYYWESSGDILRRRALVDGVRDEGWFAAPPSDISWLNPSGEHLMIGGTRRDLPGLEAPREARFTLLSKTEPNTIVADWTFGDPELDEYAGAIRARSSGGWLGNVANFGQPYTRVVSLGGPVDEELDGSFAMTPDLDSRVISLHERPEGLLLFGIETGVWSGRSWVLAASEDGTDLWRKPLAPCGPDIDAVIYDEAVIASDGVWVLFHVATGYIVKTMNQPLLVRLSFEGEVEAAWRFDPPHTGAYQWNVVGFVGEGDTMVASMVSRDYDGPYRFWVARLR